MRSNVFLGLFKPGLVADFDSFHYLKTLFVLFLDNVRIDGGCYGNRGLIISTPQLWLQSFPHLAWRLSLCFCLVVRIESSFLLDFHLFAHTFSPFNFSQTDLYLGLLFDHICYHLLNQLALLFQSQYFFFCSDNLFIKAFVSVDLVW